MRKKGWVGDFLQHHLRNASHQRPAAEGGAVLASVQRVGNRLR